jgi:phosphoglycolate phosphatase
MANSPALIFDLDGTLVDTAPDLSAATNGVLLAHGRKTVPPESFRHRVGHGAKALVQKAWAATGTPAGDEELAALVDEFLVYYAKNIAVHSTAFPGVEETLISLKADGFRLGVLTNKPQGMTDLLLPALKLDHYFSAIYGAGRMSYTKPDARIFHDIVRDMGGEGSGAIMIGDSVTDVATARAAGAPVILVSYGYTPEPAHTLGGDALTGDFREIPALARALLKTR